MTVIAISPSVVWSSQLLNRRLSLVTSCFSTLGKVNIVFTIWDPADLDCHNAHTKGDTDQNKPISLHMQQSPPSALALFFGEHRTSSPTLCFSDFSGTQAQKI